MPEGMNITGIGPVSVTGIITSIAPIAPEEPGPLNMLFFPVPAPTHILYLYPAGYHYFSDFQQY